MQCFDGHRDDVYRSNGGVGKWEKLNLVMDMVFNTDGHLNFLFYRFGPELLFASKL